MCSCLPCFGRKNSSRETYEVNRVEPLSPEQRENQQSNDDVVKDTAVANNLSCVQVEARPSKRDQIESEIIRRTEQRLAAARPQSPPPSPQPTSSPQPKTVREEIESARREFFDIQSLIELGEEFTDEMAAQLESIVARLEAVTTRLERAAPSGGAVADDLPAYVDAYDKDVVPAIEDFIKHSKELGGDLGTVMVPMVEEAFKTHRQLIEHAGRHKKPTNEVLQGLLKPLSEKISMIQEKRESLRRSPMFNHLSGVSEGIPVLGWVVVPSKPTHYVKDMLESVLFYTNRVIKDSKDKGLPQHFEWVKSWTKVFGVFQEYLQNYHAVSLQWNENGKVSPSTLFSGSTAGAAPPPPPPGLPPPPPPPPAAPPAATSGSDPADRSALFNAINKGGDITQGLNKVTDDMKTHKNPALRTGPKPYKAPVPAPKPTGSPKPAAQQAAKKPPRIELEMGKKWMVEYHENNQNIVIENVEPKQVVYVFKCTNSVIQVKSKVNSIILDSCKKVGVVFDDVISTFEMVNCQSVKAQLNGNCPTVSIDKTDGCLVYLKEEALDSTTIISSKSSEMNIAITKADGDLVEHPIPEQFRTVWDGKKFQTSQTDIAS
ncbi:adenylyl cyclase-associated protein 1-like [Tubulanus polymorphus]|uniref:adenylyl cyclase-associated protein 1-like n=1 Tax=Tubulanus polymorphus TaxID=672921 RepID=UPI003DA37D74